MRFFGGSKSKVGTPKKGFMRRSAKPVLGALAVGGATAPIFMPMYYSAPDNFQHKSRYGDPPAKPRSWWQEKWDNGTLSDAALYGIPVAGGLAALYYLMRDKDDEKA